MNSLSISHIKESEDTTVYDKIVAESSNCSADETIRKIKQFLSIHPSFPQAHNDLGVLYLRAGNPTLALAHHEKAGKLQPENITFKKNLADFYAVQLSWYDDAVDIYLEILKRNPRDTEALIALGRLGNAMENNATLEAPEKVQQLEAPAIQKTPICNNLINNSSDFLPPFQGEGRGGDGVNTEISRCCVNTTHPHPNLPLEGEGTKSSKLAQMPKTPPDFQKVSENSVGSFDDLQSKGVELANNSHYKEAAALFEAALELKPNSAVVHNDLGVVRYNLEEIPASLQHYQKAVELAPNNPVFARNLADLYFTQPGKVDEAIAIYLELHKKFPRDIETLVNLGHICSAVGHPPEAKSFYRRALEIEPWNNEARQALSTLNASSTPSSQDLQQTFVNPPQTPEDAHKEAIKHKMEGRHHEAHSILEELVHNYPQYAAGHNDLGILRHDTGNTKGAESSYREAIRLQPRNTDFRKNLADLCYAVLGNTDEAIHIYLELLKEQPRDIETLLALGLITAEAGHPAEAKNFYRRALEIEPWNMTAREALKSL